MQEDEKEEKKEWVKSKGGRKKETAEEKKQRKLQVKAEQREKRMQKKSIKEAFKSEGARIAKRAGTEQSIDHVSVYHYGNS